MHLFLDPSRLLLLGLVVPVAILLLHLERKRSTALEMIGAPVRLRPQWEVLTACATLALLFLALARPQNGSQETGVILPGKNILFIVDISRSMDAGDIVPSRIEMTKRKLLDAVRLSEASGRLDRIAIVLFSGRPFFYCPFTSDYGVLRSFIAAISTESTTSLGSNIERAVDLAIFTTGKIHGQRAQMVLLSDGEDGGVKVERTVQKLIESGIPLNVIGVGGRDGVALQTTGSSFTSRDLSGRSVYTKLNEEVLNRLASGSGGKYIRVQLDDLDLRAVLGSDSFLPQLPSRLRVYREAGPFLCLAALLSGVLLFRRRWAMLLALFVLSIPIESRASGPAMTLREAYAAYQKGEYETARSAFHQYAVRYPDDAGIQEIFGNSLFKCRKYREALLVYQRALPMVRSGRDRYRILFNTGNTLFALDEYKDAIALYERALQVKENDEHAVFNRDLARIYLDARTQVNPPPAPGSENLQGGASEDPSSDNNDGQPEEKHRVHVEELRLIPANEPVETGKQKAEAWIDALPETPILPQNNKQVFKEIPEQWW